MHVGSWLPPEVVRWAQRSWVGPRDVASAGIEGKASPDFYSGIPSCTAQKIYRPCQWRVRGGSAYLCEHERAVIQPRDLRLCRSCARDGDRRVGPPQETERTDSIDA